jgi:hypothetical protein
MAIAANFSAVATLAAARCDAGVLEFWWTCSVTQNPSPSLRAQNSEIRIFDTECTCRVLTSNYNLSKYNFSHANSFDSREFILFSQLDPYPLPPIGSNWLCPSLSLSCVSLLPPFSRSLKNKRSSRTVRCRRRREPSATPLSPSSSCRRCPARINTDSRYTRVCFRAESVSLHAIKKITSVAVQ